MNLLTRELNLVSNSRKSWIYETWRETFWTMANQECLQRALCQLHNFFHPGSSDLVDASFRVVQFFYRWDQWHKVRPHDVGACWYCIPHLYLSFGLLCAADQSFCQWNGRDWVCRALSLVSQDIQNRPIVQVFGIWMGVGCLSMFFCLPVISYYVYFITLFYFTGTVLVWFVMVYQDLEGVFVIGNCAAHGCGFFVTGHAGDGQAASWEPLLPVARAVRGPQIKIKRICNWDLLAKSCQVTIIGRKPGQEETRQKENSSLEPWVLIDNMSINFCIVKHRGPL